MLVSIITPITESRRNFIPNLERMIAAQDYPHIEHIYVWDEGTIGHKRNLGCERAKGDIIFHFDSDDIYAADWVSRSVEVLLSTGADICGLNKIWFYHPQQSWQYIWKGGPWVAGATMCYHKAFWQRGKFEDVNVGEDNNFAWKDGTKLAVSEYTDGFVAMLHDNNTAPHRKGSNWHKREKHEVTSVLDTINPAWALS
jgi:glycosyltransferase involved in cell wall biosynthesis